MPRCAVCLLLLIGLISACSTTELPPESPPVPAVAGDRVSSLELARRNGLVERYEPARNRLILEGPGSRVVLFPGTTVATVNGTRVASMRRIEGEAAGSCALAPEDARRIEALLHSRAAPSAPPRTVPRPAPVKPSDTPVVVGPVLDTTVARAVRVPLKRRWRYIVIHHSGTPSGNAAAFDRHHRVDRGWDGLAYHFVIGNGKGAADGGVEVGYRWSKQLTGAHAGRAPDNSNVMNETGIGICLVGNFDETRPTANQMTMLRSLVAYLRGYCGIPAENVLLHRDIRGTRCPGKNFPRLPR